MSALNRRIARLEAERPASGNFAWARAPMSMSDEDCLRQAREQLKDTFKGEDFTLRIERAANITAFEVYFASTQSALSKLLNEIGKAGQTLQEAS